METPWKQILILEHKYKQLQTPVHLEAVLGFRAMESTQLASKDRLFHNFLAWHWRFSEVEFKDLLMSLYCLLKYIPFWHKTYCLSTETQYPPALLPWFCHSYLKIIWFVYLVKNWMFPRALRLFFSATRAQISTEKALMRNFQSDSMKKEMEEEMMTFFFLLKHSTEFLKISCGNKEESDCLWSEGNPIVFLNFASCSNSALPLRQNPTLWLSLKPI